MDIIGEWLCKSTVQVSILILLVMAVKLIVRNRLSARWQYWLWLVVLVRMVMPWVPESSVSVFNLLPDGAAVNIQQVMPAEQYVPAVATETIVPAITEPVEAIANVSEIPAKAVEVDKVESASEDIITANALSQWNWRKLVWFVWLGGVIVLAVQVFVSNFRFWWRVKGLRPVTDQGLLDLLEDCKGQMGIGTIVGVVVTDSVKSPALFGFLRPRLLLPTGMAEKLSVEQMRHVFLHELAHLKRCDIYVSWVTAILQVVHWFNPLVWFAFYQMRADREMACDSLALSMMGQDKPSDYGRTIVSMLENYSQKQYVPAMAGILEERSQLKRRITMIAGFKKNSYKWSPLAIVLLVVLGCIGIGDAKRKADDTAPDSFVKTLSNGIEVDLVGICEHPGKRDKKDAYKDTAWWRPDGSLLGYQLYDHTGGWVKVRKNERGYEFAAKITNAPDGISTRMKVAKAGSSVGGGSSSPEKDGIYLNDLRYIGTVIDKELSNTDVSVGIAAGSWETIASSGKSNDGSWGHSGHGRAEGSIVFAIPFEKDGKTIITVTHEMKDRDVRLVVVHVSGKETTPVMSSKSGGGSFVQLTATYDISLDNIKAFRLQKREFEWVEFENVSLRARDKTELENNSKTGTQQIQHALKGNWTAVSDLMPGVTQLRVAFQPTNETEGMFRFAGTMDTGQTDMTPYAYRLDTDKLILIRDKVKQTVPFSLDGNHLTLEWDLCDIRPVDDKWLEKRQVLVFERSADVNSQSKAKVASKAISIESVAAKDGIYSALLANGIKVELVGVCEHPSEGKQWWSPDGELIEKSPYKKLYNRASSTTHQYYEFALRIPNAKKDMKINSDKGDCGFNDYGNDIWAAMICLEKNKAKTDIRFGIAQGKWETVATADPKHSQGIGNIAFGKAFHTELKSIGKVIGVTATYEQNNNIDIRIVAVDQNGKTHTSCSASGIGGKSWIQRTSHFKNLEINQIKEFQFQTRSYEWIEFKSISLQPKQQTQVKAGSDERGDDDQGSAKEDGSDSKPQSKENTPLTAWQTVWASYKVNPDIATQGSTAITDYGTISFGNAYQKDGAAFVEVTDTIDRSLYEVRIVAIGTDESTHLQNGGSSSGFENIKQATVRFDTPLKDIKVFRIQIRPAKKTLLHPSGRTKLQAEVEKATANNFVGNENRYENLTFTKGMTIREALKFLGKKHKKNIIPSDKVNGQVPVTELYNVTFEEVLQAILGTHKYIIDGDFVRIYTAEEFAEIKNASLKKALAILKNIEDSYAATLGAFANEDAGSALIIMEAVLPHLHELEKTCKAAKTETSILTFTTQYKQVVELIKQGENKKARSMFEVLGDLGRNLESTFQKELNFGKYVSVKDVKAKQANPHASGEKAKVGSKLEFRIVSDLTPSQAEAFHGLDSSPAGYQWMPIKTLKDDAIWYRQLPHFSSNDMVYLLVSKAENETMLADGSWGLEKTFVTNDNNGHPAVYIWFDESGSQKFLAITKKNIERSLAICIDGKINSVPMIMTAISKRAIITGNFTEEQATKLAESLQKGMQPKKISLPGKIKTAVLLPSIRKVLDLSTGKIIDVPVEKKSQAECLAYIEQNCGCGIMFDHDGDMSHWGFINVLHVDRHTKMQSGVKMMSFVSKNMPQEVVVTANDGKRYRIQITKAEDAGGYLNYHQLPSAKTEVEKKRVLSSPESMEWVSIKDSGVDKDRDGTPDHEGFNGQMSKFETTNAQYCQFLNAALGSDDIVVEDFYVKGANGTNAGADYSGKKYYFLGMPGSYYGTPRINFKDGVFTVDSGFENHPVNSVSWYGATAFCNYYAYRLPTEWEWEAVADYDGGYTYGCGTSIDSSTANYDGNNPIGFDLSTKTPYTSPVGHFPAYGYGMHGMAGNVWEWTNTAIPKRPDYSIRIRPSSIPRKRVLRGGSWYDPGSHCTVSFRHDSFPEDTGSNVGFRVIATDKKTTTVNKVGIELVGVCEYPSKGKQWWCVDGEPLGYAIKTLDSSNYDSDDPGYVFVFRKSGGGPFKLESVKGCKMSSSVQITQPKGLVGRRAHVKGSYKKTDIKISMPSGDWKTIVSSNGKSSTSGKVGSKTIIIAAGVQAGEHVVISTSDEIGYTDASRLTAVDPEGKTHIGVLSTDTGVNNIRQRTYHFAYIDLSDVVEFRFQTCKKKYKTFKDIPLRPRQ